MCRIKVKHKTGYDVIQQEIKDFWRYPLTGIENQVR